MNEQQQFPDFDGATYDRGQDHARLSTLLGRVQIFLSDCHWRTLAEIRAACGGSEASVSARVRDLRKEKFGAFRMEAQRVRGGLWRYRMAPLT